mgnify:CR=1 FL=1
MKTLQKYLFIYIPIGIFCCIINFCIKEDNKTPRARFYLFYDLERILQRKYRLNKSSKGDSV